MLATLTDGKVTGTGALTLTRGVLGAVLISTDGTNAAAVSIKSAAGKKIFDILTKQPLFIEAHIEAAGGDIIEYTVSGTGALAQFYEWVR
jgi:predicted sulfurtransferase